MSDSYPKEASNTVNRYKHQATYDVDTIQTIVNNTPVLHISFVPDPSVPVPVVLPMIGQIGQYSNDLEPHCYLHGYVSSRIMNLAAAPPGIPLCVAATKVDGFVLTLTPNTHNYNYRSAILHGHGTIVENTEEKLWAMQLVTNSVVPDRYENSRVPPDGSEMQSTRILKLKIESASGKVREGVPEDEKKDMKRADVLDSVWTGVIPVYEKLAEPVSGPYNRVKEVPEHVKRFVDGENARRWTYAVEAARKPAPVKRVKRDNDGD